MAVRAILGQQVSVKGATTMAGRVAEKFGAPYQAAKIFPSAATLAEADLTAVGVTGARARSIRNLARRIASGENLVRRFPRRRSIREPPHRTPRHRPLDRAIHRHAPRRARRVPRRRSVPAPLRPRVRSLAPLASLRRHLHLERIRNELLLPRNPHRNTADRRRQRVRPSDRLSRKTANRRSRNPIGRNPRAARSRKPRANYANISPARRAGLRSAVSA